jgi:DUF305 family protein family protein
MEALILHHEEAIVMAQKLLEKPNVPKNIAKLAKTIIRTQTEEIDQMKSLLKPYDRDRHYDDRRMIMDVGAIVDEYFTEHGRRIRPWYDDGESNYTITDQQIQDRKDSMCKSLQWVRNRNHCKTTQRCYWHYVGADSSSDELCNFYYHVYNNYYGLIGCSWKNR